MLLVWLFVSLWIDLALCQDASSIIKTCWQNGKRQLALYADETSTSCQAFVAQMTNVDVDVDFAKDKVVFSRDTIVIVSSWNNTGFWIEHLDKVYSSKAASSILIILDVTDQQQTLNELKLQLQPLDSYFYLVLADGTTLSWKQIITLQNNDQAIINDVSFDEQGYIIEDYDLQGIQVETLEGNWAPFFTSEHCPDDLNCKPEGYLADAFRILELMYNFRWKSTRDPNNNWGTTPISGPANISGEWGGIVGSILHNNKSISVSAWGMNLARSKMFDFAQVFRTNQVLVTKPSPPEADLELFIRPFNRSAWITLGFVILVILTFCLIVDQSNLDDQTAADGLRMFKAVGWLTFVLIQIYYSGTLTMFFTSDYTVPYDSIIDVFKSSSTVKLMFQKGDDFFFVYEVASGDPYYNEYWDKVQNDPDKYTFKTDEEGIEEVLKGDTIVFTSESKVKGYLKQNPDKVNKLALFGRSSFSTRHLIFPQNSPLAPVFRQGFLRLSETGIIDKLYQDWIGQLQSGTKSSAVLTVLSAGQVVLVFIITIAIFGFVMITLTFELAIHHWYKLRVFCFGEKIVYI